MFWSSQIDSPSARHLRRSQHEKWKVLIRVENSQQWPQAGHKNTIYQLYTNEIMQMASKWPTKTNDDLCIEICLHLQLIVFLWCIFSNKEYLNPTYIITSAIKRQVSNCKCERGIFCFGWVYQSWTIVFCLCQLKWLNSGVTF